MRSAMLPDNLHARLQEIHHLLTSGAGPIQAGNDAMARIDDVVSELRASADDADPSVTPCRLMIAHLRAATVEIEQTHLASAAENIEKAIYVAGHESQIGDPDPQLNV